MTFENLTIERDGAVATLWLDRPEKLNALHRALWARDPGGRRANSTPTPRCARSCSPAAARRSAPASTCSTTRRPWRAAARCRAAASRRSASGARSTTTSARYQQTVSSFANTNKPVIAAVHGACIGAGMDLITACDIRLASADAVFSVRETKIAMVADVGTLQRLPRVIGDGPARELIFTGRDIDATRALAIGLVNDVLPDHESLHARAQALAQEIAANSPLAVQGSKQVLGFAMPPRRRCGARLRRAVELRRSCTRRISPRR